MIPASFSALYTPVSKILTTGFKNNNKIEVAIRTKTDNATNFSVNNSRTLDKNETTSSFAVARREATTYGDVTVNASYALDGKAEVKVTNEKLYDGLKVGLAGVVYTTATPNKTENATLNVEYRNRDYGTVTGEVKVEPGFSTTATASALFARKGYAAGTDATLNANTGVLTDYNFGLSYYTSNYVAAALLNKKCTEAVVGVGHQVNSGLGLAVEVKQKLPSSDKPLVTVGTQYSADLNTIVGLKLDSTGIASLAYTYDVSKSAQLNLSAEVDSKNLSAPHKLGLGLTFNF